ncbi:MAG: MogA/MoaB family molybdenum cofactor biosynthesis protein [Methanosarcinales archaeon]|nr:MogA/MoaB family molybdenum cofactor biosynthesis protein [Methanosarcinales archaeon]
MTAHGHKHHVSKDQSNEHRICVITVSTSRYEQFGNNTDMPLPEDASGMWIVESLKEKGYKNIAYSLISDDINMIRESVNQHCTDSDIIIITGGTGITPKDVTIEAVSPLIAKEMPGFGELFRMKSVTDIGFAVMLSRAVAGIVAHNCIVFCLPGSTNAVKTGMEIILPEIGHLVKHAQGI